MSLDFDAAALQGERDQLLLEREAFRRTILKHMPMIGYTAGERRSLTIGPNLDAADKTLSDDGELLRMSLTDLLQRIIEGSSVFTRIDTFQVGPDHPMVMQLVRPAMLLKLLIRRYRTSKAVFVARMQTVVLSEFDLDNSLSFAEWLAKRSVIWRLLFLSLLGRAKGRGLVSRAAAGMMSFPQVARLGLLEAESLQSQELIRNLQIEVAALRASQVARPERSAP